VGLILTLNFGEGYVGLYLSKGNGNFRLCLLSLDVLLVPIFVLQISGLGPEQLNKKKMFFLSPIVFQFCCQLRSKELSIYTN